MRLSTTPHTRSTACGGTEDALLPGLLKVRSWVEAGTYMLVGFCWLRWGSGTLGQT